MGPDSDLLASILPGREMTLFRSVVKSGASFGQRSDPKAPESPHDARPLTAGRAREDGRPHSSVRFLVR